MVNCHNYKLHKGCFRSTKCPAWCVFYVCKIMLVTLTGNSSFIKGHQHSSEIAFMSLDLLYSVSSFCIPHRPYEKIKIRVGVNSGSCVAGKKMSL